LYFLKLSLYKIGLYQRPLLKDQIMNTNTFKALATIGLLTVSMGVNAQLLKYTSADTINGKPEYEAALKGRLKFNGVYDIKGNLHGNSTFAVQANDVNGADRPGLWVDMRQSQIRFDGTRRFANGKEIFARLEGDFEGGPSNKSTFRIRHAFVQYGNFLIGQTWSTFGDGDMWPASLFDWDGPTGMVESRRPMLRYTGNVSSKLQTELAAEIMEPRRLYDYTIPEAANSIYYEPRRLPDFIGTLKYNMNPGFLKVAAIYRNIGYGFQDEYKSTDGYGVSAMANFFFGTAKKNNLQIQYNNGKGIADYFLSVGGCGYDGTTSRQDAGELSLLPVNSGYTSYQHYWTKIFHTTLIASYNNFDGKDANFGWNSMKNVYAGGNMMFDVVPSLTVGAEFLWGKKTLEFEQTKQSLPASRVNFGFLFLF